ncbi:hypothetical protein ACFL0V_05255 [Nanoarchaeota archaeon]
MRSEDLPLRRLEDYPVAEEFDNAKQFLREFAESYVRLPFQQVEEFEDLTSSIKMAHAAYTLLFSLSHIRGFEGLENLGDALVHYHGNGLEKSVVSGTAAMKLFGFQEVLKLDDQDYVVFLRMKKKEILPYIGAAVKLIRDYQHARRYIDNLPKEAGALMLEEAEDRRREDMRRTGVGMPVIGRMKGPE